MGKGDEGQCAEAVRAMMRPGDRKTFAELFEATRRMESWKEDTIRQVLMSRVVNLVPARYHWRSAIPFLFLNGDGTYELYDPSRHPAVRER